MCGASCGGAQAASARPPGPPPSYAAATTAATTFSAGDRVEVFWQDDDAWYPGKVVAISADGTCDVAYDDGDREAGIDVCNIRKKS